MSEALEIEATWEAEPEFADEIRENLESEGAEFHPAPEDAAEVAPLVLIAFGLGLVALARAIIRVLREAKHHGVIIDARKKKLKIKEDKSLPYGTVIVINKRGESSTRTDVRDHDELANLIRVAM